MKYGMCFLALYGNERPMNNSFSG